MDLLDFLERLIFVFIIKFWERFFGLFLVKEEKFCINDYSGRFIILFFFWEGKDDFIDIY